MQIPYTGNVWQFIESWIMSVCHGWVHTIASFFFVKMKLQISEYFRFGIHNLYIAEHSFHHLNTFILQLNTWYISSSNNLFQSQFKYISYSNWSCSIYLRYKSINYIWEEAKKFLSSSCYIYYRSVIVNNDKLLSY